MSASTSGLRVLVAPDKFKGTLSGPLAAETIAAGVADVLPDADVRTLVIADGGEGTVDAALADGGGRRVVQVSGPLGVPVEAVWARLGRHAVLELAASSGLHLVVPSVASALAADTVGLGDTIRAALDDGARSLLIGVGGSATTDGGTGALRALGARFLDDAGQEVRGGGDALIRIRRAELSGLDERLATTSITMVADVNAPLLGPSGAAAVYGPQKGADAATVALLDAGLANLATVLALETGRDMAAVSGGGAAGGTAGGLYAAVGADIVQGIDRIAELIDLDAQIAGADLVITGEGSFDTQSLQGKGPAGVIERARRAGRPVLVVAGRLTIGEGVLAELGVAASAAAAAVAPTAGDALGSDAALWVRRAAAMAVSTWLGEADVAR